MNDLGLRFCDGTHPDLRLDPGVHALGRTPAGIGPVDSNGNAVLHLCNDRRGIWMTVAEGVRGVHVNGRPVHQVAMLRAGDSIHAEGSELLLQAGVDDRLPPPGTPPRIPAGHLRLTLRGIGGPFHGRCVGLEKPCRVGSAADADLRIEGTGIASRHALLEPWNGSVLLRQTAQEVMVNGHPVREAVLRNGDQIVFDVQHRFVLEGPPPAASAMPAHGGRAPAESEATVPTAARHWTRRIPWLLVSALLLAGALAALLVFGAR